MSGSVNRRTFVAGAAMVAASVAGARADEASPIASPNAGGEEAVSIQANKDLVTAAIEALFNQHDLSVVDRYVGPEFEQHSSVISDGRDGMRQYIEQLDTAASYELVRIFGDGDLVATHGRYTGFGAEPLIAFDVYRIADGKIIEHWDGIQPEAGPNPSGHTMLDGPMDVTAPEQTEETRSFLNSFVEAILLGRQPERFTDFIGTYIQHNPVIADGLEGLSAARGSISAEYRELHLTVIEGEFGLLVLDGTFNGQPAVYYDLFRVQNGKIEEHWDVIEAVTWG